ncbi:beta-ketoacyl synthase N-terminal-like domain-containing protein [Kitasatospora sp. NPDC058170]|uniref:beta-ketoacyl synthase N-terminal-like domain-containing protein n=1 Tax=Kitasatospora sp. NPDC058170 TaxID=3346364 RepID=UPI0036DD8E22
MNDHVNGRPDAALDPGPAPGPAVAVIGLACRFPGARDLGEYRELLLRDGSAVQRFTDGTDLTDLTGGPDGGPTDGQAADPRYVPVGGELADVDLFDAEYFGIAPAEAAAMDPQQRLLLQEAVHALEHAGWAGGAGLGRVGVFCGSGDNRYGTLIAAGGAEPAPGTTAAALPLRVSYHLGLTGPSVFVASLCSTALTALHLARRSLLAGDCDAALVGAVTVALPHERGYLAVDGGVLSPSGACRPFDRRADGTVPGSGVAVVVLKLLADALRDGDTVHAVLRGSALNNDGAARLSFAAPSVDGQRDVLLAAWAESGVDPATIGYLEAHGTGTPLGDPVELAALLAARRRLGVTAPCAVGSAKAALGHLDAAAGMAGLIRAVLAVRDAVVPGTAGHRETTTAVDLAGSGLHVPSAAAPWPASDEPRRAAVTALGVGGTNAHAVLEQPPARPAAPAAAGPQLLPLSARSPWSFERSAAAVRGLLGEAGTDPAALARALQVGRAPGRLRRAWTAADPAGLAAALAAGPATPVDGPLVLGLADGDDPADLSPADATADTAPAAAADATAGTTPEAAAGPGHPSAPGFARQLAALRALAALGVEPAALAASGAGEFAALAFAGGLDEDTARRCAGHHATAVAAARTGGDLSACERAMAALEAELAAAEPGLLQVEVRSATLGTVLPAGTAPSPTHLLDVTASAVLGEEPAALPPGARPVVPVDGDAERWLRLVADCWERGADIRWERLRPAGGRTAAPPYPFQPVRHWHPAVPDGRTQRPAPAEPPPGPQDPPPGATTLETVLAIWCEVLGLPEVAPADDFFVLGGHSILAAQVLARIRESYGVRIPLGDLLDAETAEATAALIDTELASSQLYRTLVGAPDTAVGDDWEEVEL